MAMMRIVVTCRREISSESSKAKIEVATHKPEYDGSVIRRAIICESCEALVNTEISNLDLETDLARS